MVLFFFFLEDRLKLQEPQGKSKKSWIKTDTGKKDRLEKRKGSAVAARGHSKGCHLLPRTGTISVIVSKPMFKKQGNVTRGDSDYPREEHLGVPTLSNWPQSTACSVQICISRP